MTNSKLLNYLIIRCNNSHAFGNDGMVFIDTPEELYEDGFTDEDVKVLMEDIKRYNLWNVCDVAYECENYDAYITCYGDFSKDAVLALMNYNGMTYDETTKCPVCGAIVEFDTIQTCSNQRDWQCSDCDTTGYDEYVIVKKAYVDEDDNEVYFYE